jgi:hypothetical protein
MKAQKERNAAPVLEKATMARSKRVRKISLPTAFDSQAVQAVASRYTDWDI